MSEAEARVDIRYRPTLSELAEGFRLIAKARHPIGYRLGQLGAALGVIFVGLSFGLVAALGMVEETRTGDVCMTSWVPAFLLLFATLEGVGRPWLMAVFTALAQRGEEGENVLESFSRREVRVRSSFWTGASSPGAFKYRIESERLFVFGRGSGHVGILIPKRIFADDSTRDAFRELAVRTPSGEEVAAAVRVFGDGPSEGDVTFMPDLDEQYRGMWLLFVRTAPLGIRLFFFAMPLAAVGFALTPRSVEDVPFMVLLLVFLAGVIVVSFRRAKQRARQNLKPVTVRIDAHGVSLSTDAGTLEVEWAQALGYLDEDPRLLIVVSRPGYGVFLPKRAFPVEKLEEIKARLRCLDR